MRVWRFGIEEGRVDCMLLILLRARSSTRNRGDRGKLVRDVMSLSVKSMESDWSYKGEMILFSKRNSQRSGG